jgi:diacylglycerol O-acyltransferase
MQLISPIDSTFLLAESREHPLHVAGLQLFTPPADAGPEFARETFEAMRAHQDLTPTFRKRPAAPLGAISNVAWTLDDDVDMDYHVRRSALPTPGRVRELLELTSRLHGAPLDRHRPLWEMHLIEGLNDGRFAIYTKMHHAVVDGVSALNLLQGSLSTDPDDREVQAPWSVPPREVSRRATSRGRFEKFTGTMQSAMRQASSAVTLGRAALLEQQLTLPFQAPCRSAALAAARRSPGRWTGSRTSRTPPV